MKLTVATLTAAFAIFGVVAAIDGELEFKDRPLPTDPADYPPGFPTTWLSFNWPETKTPALNKPAPSSGEIIDITSKNTEDPAKPTAKDPFSAPKELPASITTKPETFSGTSTDAFKTVSTAISFFDRSRLQPISGTCTTSEPVATEIGTVTVRNTIYEVTSIEFIRAPCTSTKTSSNASYTVPPPGTSTSAAPISGASKGAIFGSFALAVVSSAGICALFL